MDDDDRPHWDVPARDAVGRVRVLTVSVTSVGEIAVIAPPGCGWGDMIQIRNSDDAAAIRLNPLKELVWKYEGDMTGAIDALLELPHPDHQNAPHLAIGTLRGLWTP